MAAAVATTAFTPSLCGSSRAGHMPQMAACGPLWPGVAAEAGKRSRVLALALAPPNDALRARTPSPPPTMNSRTPKQSMSELKLRRLVEHNQRLKEDLARPRVRVSEASARSACLHHSLAIRPSVSVTAVADQPRLCLQPDPLLQEHARHAGTSLCEFPFTPNSPRRVRPQVPSVWGQVGKGEDPYAPPAQGCNCAIM